MIRRIGNASLSLRPQQARTSSLARDFTKRTYSNQIVNTPNDDSVAPSKPSKGVYFARQTSNVPINIPASELLDEDSDMLQPIKVAYLPRAQKRFAEQFDEYNKTRSERLCKHVIRGVLIGLGTGSCCFAIYLYTIFTFKQETFLEEIDKEVAEELGPVNQQAVS
ncbi:coiled-coil domain-containing protein 56 domain-containing protein [Ditylenchus destructor]|nr:coiled-coil domain-containing protein 56 domain-containing protein [Ditylenchus destructor]